MKCCACKRNIAAGVDATKMIVEYQQSDGTTKIFGYMMPDGPLAAATGQILRAWHHKHYHVERKREARGDAVTGRVLAGAVVPTGYDDLADTRHLSAQAELLREIARSIGKGVGDPHVIEAFRAREHGGPYPHSHHLPLETYQLLAHLKYAHGIDFEACGLVALPRYHHELHAAAALAETAALRADEPDHGEDQTRDWRDQYTVDLGEPK